MSQRDLPFIRYRTWGNQTKSDVMKLVLGTVRQTDRQTDEQTDRLKDTNTDRQVNTYVYMYGCVKQGCIKPKSGRPCDSITV